MHRASEGFSAVEAVAEKLSTVGVSVEKFVIAEVAAGATDNINRKEHMNNSGVSTLYV